MQEPDSRSGKLGETDFTIVDSGGSVEKAEKMDTTLEQESVEADQYEVNIGSKARNTRTALDNVSGELSPLSIESRHQGKSMALVLHQSGASASPGGR